MFGLGMGEILAIIFVIILLFGAKKLPQLGSAMGKTLTNFKKGLKESSEENRDLPAEQEKKDPSA